MFWLLLTLLLITGGILLLRRKAAYVASEDEPWRRSLADDAPLDIDEIRSAEEEWTSGSDWQDLPDDESWRS